MRRYVPLFLLLVSAHFVLGQAVTYKVDAVNGVDSNERNGTTEPWKTIQYAVENATGTEIRVEIAPGDYREEVITVSKPIVFAGQAGVVITPASAPLFNIDISTPAGLVIIQECNFVNNETEEVTAININQVNNLNLVANTFDGFTTAVQLGTLTGEVNINENYFLNYMTGVSVPSTLTETTDFSLSGNSFDSNIDGALAVISSSTSVINAEYNWWAQGVAQFDGISVVDFSPYLNTGAEADSPIEQPGFQGDRSSVTLGGGPSYDPTRNELQEAYDEENTEEIVLMGGSSFDSLVANKPATLVVSEDTATIDDLRIDMSSDDSLFIEGKMLINSSISLTSGNIKTVGTESLVILGDVGDPLEEGGRMRGNFTIVPREVGTGGLTVLGLRITGKIDADDLGTVKVTRINGNEGTVRVNVGSEEVPDFNESIRVRWIIEAQRQPTNGRTLKFSWREEDNNGKDPAATIAWRLAEGSTEWEAISTEPVDALVSGSDLQTISVPNVTQFSTWTISDVNEPLPVVLTDFTAQVEDKSVRLRWATASEINSDYFSVERSTDGYTYEPLSRTKAAGESYAERRYLYIDEGVANRLSGTVYYRLHMVDFDGSSEYSPVVAASLEGESSLGVYASRETNTFKLFASLPEAAYTVQVSDLLGRVMYETRLPTQANVREYALPVPPLPPSVYTLRCIGRERQFVRKFRVE